MLLAEKPFAFVTRKFKTVFLNVVMFAGILSQHRGQAMAQSLSLSPSSGPGNCLVTATSSGFQPDVTGTNYGNTGFYGPNYQFLAACPRPTDGANWSIYANCSVNIRIPADHGNVVITAGYYGQSATATFTVDPPSLSITPTWGPPGTTVTVHGKTFTAVGYTSVFLDDAFQTQQLTDEAGDFTASFTVQTGDIGPHLVTAGYYQKASATFYLITNGIGSVTNLQGTATITHPGGEPMQLQTGMPISMGDQIHTGPNSTLNLTLADNTQFNVSENSKLTIDNYVYDPNNNANNKASYNVLEGAFDYLSGLVGKTPNPDVKIETDFSYIGIRGTHFIARQDPCSVTQEIYLIEGQLAITPKTTAGVTNVLDAPVSIFITSNNVVTNVLTQAMYDSLSNAIVHVTGPVTLGSWLTYYFGCTNTAAAAPNADPDGDGQSNLNEFLAGTDPTSNASSFRILSAAAAGNDMRVTWICGGGRTNVLQSATKLGGNWSNVSANIFLAGSGDMPTNYLDIGATTNAAAKFYRVQLIQ